MVLSNERDAMSQRERIRKQRKTREASRRTPLALQPEALRFATERSVP